MQVLTADHLSKVYKGRVKNSGTRALNGISLTIESGDFVAIMGPSGSGKTTLLNILSGIDAATGGTVEISGTGINDMPRDQLALFRRQRMGFIFQEFNLLDSLTLKENIMLPMVLDRREAAEIENRAREVMALLEISAIADKYPYAVSGGQQQRTAIARAIVNRPGIVFADEPTGNLDSKSAKTVMKYFSKINSLNSCTVLIVTHDPFAASYSNKVIFIKDGLIHSEITRKGDRKDFFDYILETLAVIGGEKDDV